MFFSANYYSALHFVFAMWNYFTCDPIPLFDWRETLSEMTCGQSCSWLESLCSWLTIWRWILLWLCSCNVFLIFIITDLDTIFYQIVTGDGLYSIIIISWYWMYVYVICICSYLFNFYVSLSPYYHRDLNFNLHKYYAHTNVYSDGCAHMRSV